MRAKVVCYGEHSFKCELQQFLSDQSLIRQIQTTQCAFNFSSNFPSFKTLIIHEGAKTVFRKLGWHQIFLRDDDHLRPSTRNVLSLFLEIFRIQESEITLLQCNEFPYECILSVCLDNPHCWQKKDFYFSSFPILTAHNAQHQFLISASFCITAELANICKHYNSHTFRAPSTEFDSFSKFCNKQLHVLQTCLRSANMGTVRQVYSKAKQTYLL